jgi:hypothetical protein
VLPSCPWDRSRNFRVFANLGFRFNPRAVTASLTSFTLSFRVHQRSSCFALAPVSRGPSSAPPVESLAPPVFPHMGQRLFPGSDLHGRSVCASRCSQPPDAFIRPMSASLIACWIHAWGFTLQSFPPPVQPYAVSDAVALLSLRHPSFRSVSHRPSDFSASCGLGLQRSERPSPSGLCSTPESATSTRRFRPTRAHGSHGLFVLQGSLPLRHNRTFTRFPLTSFVTSTQNSATEAAPPRSPPRLPRVSVPEEMGLALVWHDRSRSRSEPADPLELRTPFDHPRELETSTGPGVASSSIGVHRCPLTCSL